MDSKEIVRDYPRKSNLVVKKESLIGCFFENIEKTYNFVKELGSGSFGKVFLIENITTKESYACKRLSKRKIVNKDSIVSEINLLRELDHPNIVKLFEIYEDKVYLFLVMELLNGGELFDRILTRATSGKYYSEKEVAVIFKQIVSAINYCHMRGVCHRDIKPENIIFVSKSEDSPVKIIDFGLSKSFNRKKEYMKTKVGTCFYMPPEVIKGSYNEKCDVWSLGVLLFVLISGRAPFNDIDNHRIASKILEGKFEFKWEGWKLISDDCKKLIRQILVKEDIRPTASDVLMNPWIELLAPNALESPINIDFDELKIYSQMDKFHKAVTGFIAFRLKEDEVKELTETFQSIDKNRNGTLSFSEFKESLGLFNRKTDEELLEIFGSIDLDCNKEINYNEFITATFDRKKSITRDNLYQAFKAFDSDKNGKISLKELKRIITAESIEGQQEAEDLFKLLDKNGDGEIDFEEFLESFCEN